VSLILYIKEVTAAILFKEKQMSSKMKFNLGVVAGIILIILTSVYINRDIRVEKHFNYHYSEGIVLKVAEERIEPHDLYPTRSIGRQELQIKILKGKYKDRIFDITNFISAERNIIASPGMKAIFTIRETGEGGEDLGVWLYNYKSSRWIYILTGIFLGTILIFSGRKGLESILALIFTSTVIFFVLIPLLFTGRDPILYSILVTLFITCISLLLIGEFDRKTLAAILGTMSGIIIAGVMAYSFGRLARLSNTYLEYGDQLLYLSGKFPIKFDGLIFTGILIASLGAVMDVAMSIASSAFELSETSRMSYRDLFIRSMNIGRDIMGTMTNTLILAFTGGALNLLLMIWGFRMTYTQVMNMPVFATEVVQALSGSIGIVLTVPFTAAISAYTYSRKR